MYQLYTIYQKKSIYNEKNRDNKIEKYLEK